MRIVLLSATAIALSGCSWLGGNSKSYNSTSYAQNTATYNSQHASNCCNDKILSRWNIEGGIGAEFLSGDDFLDAEDAISNTPFTHNNVSMRNAFGTGTRYDIGGSYAINPNLKLTATGYKTEHNGRNINVGTDAMGATLRGQVSDYEAYGLEAGLRQYALPIKAPLVNSVRPYVEGRIGAANINDLRLTNATLGGVATADQLIYDGGWVPTGAGLIGIETPVFNRFTMGLETGIRYTGKLDGHTSGGTFGVGGISEGTNGESDKWSVPLMLRGRYRF